MSKLFYCRQITFDYIYYQYIWKLYKNRTLRSQSRWKFMFIKKKFCLNILTNFLMFWPYVAMDKRSLCLTHSHLQREVCFCFLLGRLYSLINCILVFIPTDWMKAHTFYSKSEVFLAWMRTEFCIGVIKEQCLKSQHQPWRKIFLSGSGIGC